MLQKLAYQKTKQFIDLQTCTIKNHYETFMNIAFYGS